jgi:hypothetical protein
LAGFSVLTFQSNGTGLEPGKKHRKSIVYTEGSGNAFYGERRAFCRSRESPFSSCQLSQNHPGHKERLRPKEQKNLPLKVALFKFQAKRELTSYIIKRINLCNRGTFGSQG